MVDDNGMSEHQLEELRTEVSTTLAQLSEEQQKIHQVHRQLSEIEQVKEDVSTWCIDVMNSDEPNQNGGLKVPLYMWLITCKSRM